VEKIERGKSLLIYRGYFNKVKNWYRKDQQDLMRGQRDSYENKKRDFISAATDDE